jgi:hypothetical protein
MPGIVNGADQEDDPRGYHGDALKDAQRAGLEAHAILQIKGDGHHEAAHHQTQHAPLTNACLRYPTLDLHVPSHCKPEHDCAGGFSSSTTAGSEDFRRSP